MISSGAAPCLLNSVCASALQEGKGMEGIGSEGKEWKGRDRKGRRGMEW